LNIVYQCYFLIICIFKWIYKFVEYRNKCICIFSIESFWKISNRETISNKIVLLHQGIRTIQDTGTVSLTREFSPSITLLHCLVFSSAAYTVKQNRKKIDFSSEFSIFFYLLSLLRETVKFYSVLGERSSRRVVILSVTNTSFQRMWSECTRMCSKCFVNVASDLLLIQCEYGRYAMHSCRNITAFLSFSFSVKRKRNFIS